MPSTKPSKGTGSPTRPKTQSKSSKKAAQSQSQSNPSGKQAQVPIQSQVKNKPIAISKGPAHRQGSTQAQTQSSQNNSTSNRGANVQNIQPSPHAMQHAPIQPQQQHQKYTQHTLAPHALGIPIQVPPTISPGSRSRQPLPQTLYRQIYTTGGTAALPDSRLVAYAKIVGTDFEYFMQTLSIIVGRTAAVSLTTEPSHLDVDLTGYDGIDTRHCTIMYNFDREMFELKVLSETHPVQVNGHLLKKSARPHMLRSKDLIIVGDAHFYFLLPQGEVTHERSPHDLSKSNSMPRNPPLLKSKDMFVPSGSTHPRGLVPQQEYMNYSQQPQQPQQNARHPPLQAMHSQTSHGSYGNSTQALQPAPPTHRGEDDREGEGPIYSTTTHQQVQRTSSTYSNEEQQSPYPNYSRSGPGARPVYPHTQYGPPSHGGYPPHPSHRPAQGGAQSQSGSYNGSPQLRQSQYPPTSPQHRPIATMYSAPPPPQQQQQQQRTAQNAPKKKRKATTKNADASPRKKKKEKTDSKSGGKKKKGAGAEREQSDKEDRVGVDPMGWSAPNSADQSHASSAEDDAEVDSTTEDEGHVEVQVDTQAISKKQGRSKGSEQALAKNTAKKTEKSEIRNTGASKKEHTESRGTDTSSLKDETMARPKQVNETKKKKKSKNIAPTLDNEKGSESVYYDGEATPDNTIVQVAVSIQNPSEKDSEPETTAADEGQKSASKSSSAKKSLPTKSAKVATDDQNAAEIS